MRSCRERPKASRPAQRAKNLSRVSARFSKNADRISRERGGHDKTTSDAMDRARRRGECGLVVRMLLPLRLLLSLGLPVPLRLRLSIRGGLSLSAGTGGGRGPTRGATAGARCTSAVERTDSAGAAAALAAIGARRPFARVPQAN